MKILLATYWVLPHVGGVWSHIHSLKDELERIGHEVDVFAHHPTMKSYYLVNREVHIQKKPIKEEISRKLKPYFEKNLPLVERWIVTNEIERTSFEVAAASLELEQYDLIHTHDVYATRALSRIKPKQTPLISTIHGCLASEYVIYLRSIGNQTPMEQIKQTINWKYHSLQEYYGVTSSDITIVPTYWLKMLFVNDFQVPKDQVVVIPYGLNISNFLSRMEEKTTLLPPLDNKFSIVCPARLDKVKGHKCLLNALASLNEVRNDWVCWLLGDGPLRKELEQQTKLLNLEKQVHFLGARSDLPAILKLADIFVLPSLHDNQPFAVMEGQAAGKPVIVSTAGGIPEMVEHQKTGLVFSVGQSDQLFQQIRLLMENEPLRETLADNAKKHALHQWSLETMLNRTIYIYQKIRNNQKG